MKGRTSPFTVAVRAGTPDPVRGGAPLVEPPSLASVDSFAGLDDLDHAMAAGRSGYRRYGTPIVHRLEAALAALEGHGLAEPPLCRVTASGQSALLLALSTLVGPGRRRVLLLRPCYGGSESLLSGPLAAFGVEPVVVDLPPPGDVRHQLDPVRRELSPGVGCVVAEVIGNPLLGLLDLPALVELCRSAGVASVIDGTFATPFLLRPLEMGADLVFHSLSKQLSGHADVLGGAVLIRAGHPAAERLDGHSRSLGAVMASLDAFLSLRGLRTAGLRAERGAASAAALAGLAIRHPAVAAVHYPGLRGAEEEALARRLLPLGRGSLLTLDLGSRERAERLLEGLPDIRLAPSLGDVATTVSHPGLSSHRSLSPEARRALGIGDGLLRFSVGIEALDDLSAELGTALDAVAATMGPATAVRSTPA
ncbi:MAG: trans-sulfuration enzyme family protein [Candidatus Dormibacteria bacterium]